MSKLLTNKSMKVKIREPFYGAGSTKVFGWVTDDYGQSGVGINAQHLIGPGKISIEVDGVTYRVEKADIRKFVKRYNSFRSVGNGVTLGVVSISFLNNPVFNWEK